MTKEELRKHRDDVRELDQLDELITRIRSQLESPKVARLSHVPAGGKGVTFADLVTKLMDLERKYNERWDQLIESQLKVESAIESLDGRDRVIMRAYYIQRKSWEQIAEEQNYSLIWLWQLHGRILQKLA